MRNILIFTIIVLVGMSCVQKSQKQNQPTITHQRILYYNGDIVTMKGDDPSYVDAIVVGEGKIVFIGSLNEAENKFPNAEKKNLNGSTMLPGFIDGHGHVSGVGFQAASANLLPLPDGKVKTVKDIVKEMKVWVTNNQNFIEKTGWIIGFGYDDAQLDRYPNKKDLDEISIKFPILIVHQSGHLGVLNSKALDIAGYSSKTSDPNGGVIRRMSERNEPNGVVEENGLFHVLFGKIMPSIDLELELENLHKGQEIYASYGYTTAQDGRSSKSNTKTFIEASKRNLLFLDVVAYPDIQINREAATTEYNRNNYINHYRIGGVKLSLDGSPQGKTAWLTEPYLIPPVGQSSDYKGYPAIRDDDKVLQYISDAFENNWQIMVHVNGDAAIDQLIKTVRAASEKFGNDNRRVIAIHAQIIRDDQLDEFKKLKIMPSFFPMHTFYWGDWHVNSVLGKERAYQISPTQTAFKKGLIFTSHHDAPVAFPNSIRVLSATITRISRSGKIIGPEERVSPYIALKSLTEWAAYQHFEEDYKGTLEIGKLADFVILNKNPLKISPEDINELQVLETIKEGINIYKK